MRVAAVVALAGSAAAVTLGAGRDRLGGARLRRAGRWVDPFARARAGTPAARAALGAVAALAAVTAALMLPVWLTLSAFLHGSSELFSSLSANSATGESGLVNLLHPLTVLQLGGPWPVGDFRRTAPAGSTAPLLPRSVRA